MADYDVFNIEEKWFGEAEPVNYEAGVQDGVPTRTPTIILDEDNGAVHVCNIPNPTIRNTGWTKYSTGGTPVDSDIFTVIFDLAGDVPGAERMAFTARCEFEDIFTAQEDGKKIQAFIGLGEAESGNGILGMLTEFGDNEADFSSYLVTYQNEGQAIGVIVNVTWDTREAEYPITGTMSMIPLSGGGGSDASEYLLTADVMYSTAGGFSLGNVKDVNGDDPDWDQMVDYITGRNGETKTPMRLIAHVTNIDDVPNPDFNNYVELRFTSYLSLDNTITFESSTINQNQIIFTQIIAVHSSQGGTDTISWAWGQKYLSAN